MSTNSWITDTGQVRYLPDPYELIDRPLWFHTRGLSETASGYGRRLRSPRCVRLPDGKVRRVYMTIFSNSGTCWIVYEGKKWVVR